MTTARLRSLAGVSVLLAALVGTTLVTVPPGSAWAVPSEAELNAARDQAERLEDAVRGAETELREVRAELDALEDQLGAARGELDAAIAVHDEAQAAATEASDLARAAERDLAQATSELTTNRQTLGDLARDTYKYGAQAGSPAMAAFEMMDSPTEGFADRLHYLQRGVGVRTAALQAADALQVRVSHLTERARDEEDRHRARQTEAEAKRTEAATLHAEVEQLTSETSDNLARADTLVATLEDEQDDVEVRIRDLEEQVAREREEAARRERERLEQQRREREAAERQRAEQQRAERERRQAAARAAASSSPSTGSGGGSGGSSSPVSNSPGPSPSLRSVGGITVAASLAPQLEALLNHARRDGIALSGGGYRSPEVTARLRRANGCPDVYNSPASSCRVPTARPGSSEHEKGLAVDFTYRGQTVCYPRSSRSCSGNAAFDWLRRNAGSYGLRNLPSEAWHWSTTGR